MYQALYRKWRPQVFADVVGQEHITTTLMNELESGRHSHAYLFTGSRGTGKTTCAKIFAKAVNCEHPVNGDPCNECETCKGIDSGAIMDVIEIDAASNNGVDNIRDIRDEANFTPVNGKYRVYIIDEVHMLSSGAFNALLKTLEEPPAHVKFILATTEVHKLPATILSRCQRFDFKRITPEDIAKRLGFVAEQEGLTLEADAAMLIARLADGALRDALSILDQCIGHSRHITLDVVNATVGLAGKAHLFALATSILNKDGALALEQINILHNSSCDMERLCNELTNHFRNLMVCKAVKSAKDLVVCSDEELAEYQALAAAYSMDFILEALDVLGSTLSNLHRGNNRRIEMEMAIIRLCNSETESLAKGAAPVEVKVPAPTPAPVVEKPAPVIVEPAPAVEEPAPIPEPVIEEITEEPEFEEIPFPDEPTTIPAEPIVEPEPIIEEIPKEPAPIVAEPIVDPEPVSEEPDFLPVSDDALADGEIPTNLWNAIIRETVSTDKTLIGTMNSAKAYKKGDTLLVDTDNMLLRRFLPMDSHKETIYNATFTVLGQYLKPRLLTEDDDLNFGQVIEETVPSIKESEPVIEEPAPIVEEPTPIAEPEQVEEPVPAPVPESDPIEDFVMSRPSFDDEDRETEIDPLDAFLDQIEGQTDFSLFIED